MGKQTRKGPRIKIYSFRVYQQSKHIEQESEFRNFEFVICKFIVVYMNIK